MARRRGLTHALILAGTWTAVYVLVTGFTALQGAATSEELPEGCGPVVAERRDGPAIHASSTRVMLALDEEWRATFGERAGSVARSLLSEASALFRSAHIHLLPVGVASWRSPDETDQALDLLSVVETTVDRGEADIVIAFTGQALIGSDGLARRDGRHAIIEHHPGRADRDALVLAHEVAHLFGARHGCDLPGGGGLMSESGFTGGGELCPCTERVLEANADRFHELLETPADPER